MAVVSFVDTSPAYDKFFISSRKNEEREIPRRALLRHRHAGEFAQGRAGVLPTRMTSVPSTDRRQEAARQPAGVPAPVCL